MTTALYLGTGILLLLSALRDREKTRRAVQVALRSIWGIMPIMLVTVGLIGISLALLPDSTIAALFGSGGVSGWLTISLVGAVTMIPAFVSFPLASSLLKAGAGVGEVSTFITTLTMVGVVTSPMEIQFFGRRFTLARNLLSYILALVVGLLMGVVLA